MALKQTGLIFVVGDGEITTIEAGRSRRLAFSRRAGLAYDLLVRATEPPHALSRSEDRQEGEGRAPQAIMTRRSRGREIALQVLYQTEQNPGLPREEVRRFVERRLRGDRKLCEFAEALIAGIQAHQHQIDRLISEVAENWRLDRMAAIDRNILRLGAYEMLFCPDVPTKVAINESLELAKRYSTAQSSRFVNGILDRLQGVNPSKSPPREPGPAPDPSADPA